MASLFAALVLLWVSPTAARAANGVEVVQAGDLPLAERCALAIKVAQQILNASDFNGRGAGKTGSDPQGGAPHDLDLFIARAGDRDGAVPPTALFREGETCGDVEIHSLYFPVPSLALILGTGRRDRHAHGETHQIASSETTRSAGQWTFTWPYSNRVWACPPRHDRTPYACVEPAPLLNAPPTLKITIARGARSGSFEVVKSILELE